MRQREGIIYRTSLRFHSGETKKTNFYTEHKTSLHNQQTSGQSKPWQTKPERFFDIGIPSTDEGKYPLLEFSYIVCKRIKQKMKIKKK